MDNISRKIDIADLRCADLIEAQGRRGDAFPTIPQMLERAERAAWSVERAMRGFLIVAGCVAALNIAAKVLL